MAIVYIEQVDEMSLEQMQATHESEIKILNEIDKLATMYQIHKADPAELEAKLDEYVEHVKKHFESEEVLMKKYNFPSYTMHKTAHDTFLSDLDYARRQWKNGELKKMINFIYKVPEWLLLHVNTVDTPTSNFLERKMKES